MIFLNQKILLVCSAISFTLSGCISTTQAPARILKPQEECGNVQVPIMGILDRPASQAEVIGGAVIGGLVGNQIGDGSGKDLATMVGIGAGAVAASTQRQQEQVVVGYKTEYKCRTVYK